MGLVEPATLPKLQLLKKDVAMELLAKRMHRFLVSEDGPTAVEYAVMLALIIMICLVSIQTIGTNANQTFADMAASMSAS